MKQLASPVKRQISIWAKPTDELVNDITINLSFKTLRKVFTPYEDDPFMIMVYPIDEAKALLLSDLVNIQFDLNKHEYFLEAVAA